MMFVALNIIYLEIYVAIFWNLFKNYLLIYLIITINNLQRFR